MVIIDKSGDIEYIIIGILYGILYSYDIYVLVIFYGWYIKKGELYDKKVIIEIVFIIV